MFDDEGFAVLVATALTRTVCERVCIVRDCNRFCDVCLVKLLRFKASFYIAIGAAASKVSLLRDSEVIRR